MTDTTTLARRPSEAPSVAPAARPVDPGTDKAAWVGALEAAGYGHRSAVDYAATIARAAGLLAEVGSTLRSAGPAELAAIGESWPPTRSSRTRLRSALGAASAIICRPELPWEAVALPEGMVARPARRRHQAAERSVDAVRLAWWDERAEAAGRSPSRRAGRPAAVCEAAERRLADLGSDLAHAEPAALEALWSAWPASASSKERLRAGLRLAAAVLGRPELAEEPLPLAPAPARAAPLRPAEAERFEAAAWRLGGTAGLVSLLALYTSLELRELCALGCEQIALDPGGATVTIHSTSVDQRVGGRLGAALAAAGAASGPLLSADDGRLSPAEANRCLRSVAAHAGLGSRVGPAVIRASRPALAAPALDEPLAPLLAPLDPRGPRGAPVCPSVEALRATGVCERTARNYARVAARAARLLAEAGVDLLDCGPTDLVALADRFAPGRSSQALLRSALARSWEALGRSDPPSLRAIRLPPQPRRRSKALDPEHAAALEEVAWQRREQPEGLAVLLGLYAGLRREEIARLRWELVELDAEVPEVWVQGKGDSEAAVPLHPLLVEALGATRRGAGWVFPARKGREGHVHPTTVWGWTKRIACLAGLDPARVRTHLLRHTMLTEANDRSGDLRTVQEIARHMRPETTAGYTRVDRARMASVVSLVDYGRHRGGETPPDPADAIPPASYRSLVEAIEGEGCSGPWVELGVALAAAGWRYRLVSDGRGPTLWWEHPGHPELVAVADVDHRDGSATFCLDRLEGGESDHWDLAEPAEVVAIGSALAAGVSVAGSRRFGPWIEQPFIDYLLQGPAPEMPRALRSTPELHLVPL